MLFCITCLEESVDQSILPSFFALFPIPPDKQAEKPHPSAHITSQTEDITTGLVVKTDKDAEVQTEPSYVTVEVKEVLKTYEIFVKESLKERLDEELESFWEGNGINGFSVRNVQDNFMVEISCWEFSESFTAFSAARLLSSLPWPDGISVIISHPTNYAEKKS